MICMAQRRQGGWQALTVVAILTLNRRHNDCVAERFFFASARTAAVQPDCCLFMFWCTNAAPQTKRVFNDPGPLFGYYAAAACQIHFRRSAMPVSPAGAASRFPVADRPVLLCMARARSLLNKSGYLRLGRVCFYVQH